MIGRIVFNPTPGPWHIDRKPVTWAIRNAKGEYVTENVREWQPETIRESNARLIAAAPDLLEAARLAVLNLQRQNNSGTFLGDDDHEAWTALEKAIAKAEGR